MPLAATLTPVLVASYLLGSIPSGLVICKVWKGVDIRSYGSGNIGATNVFRSLGAGPAAVVFVADVLKGLLPVLLAQRLVTEAAWAAVAAGMLAIIGHTFSAFLRFSGGKGVATSLGVLIGLEPRVAAIGLGVWLAVVAVSRYVSVASMVASLAGAICMCLLKPGAEYVTFRVFALVAAIFVIAKHRSNIARLVQRREPKLGEKVTTMEDDNVERTGARRTSGPGKGGG